MKKKYNKRVADECKITTYSHKPLRGASSICDSLLRSSATKAPPTLASKIKRSTLRGFKTSSKKLCIALRHQNMAIKRYCYSDICT